MLPFGTYGNTDASTTRRPSTPCTRIVDGSTTDSSSAPMRHVQDVDPEYRMRTCVVIVKDVACFDVVGRISFGVVIVTLRAAERSIPLLKRGLHGHGLRARVLDVVLGVVLEVLADSRQVLHEG